MFDTLTHREADTLAEIMGNGMESIGCNHVNRTEAGANTWAEMSEVRGQATDQAIEVWRGNVTPKSPDASQRDYNDYVTSGHDIGFMQWTDRQAEAHTEHSARLKAFAERHYGREAEA